MAYITVIGKQSIKPEADVSAAMLKGCSSYEFNQVFSSVCLGRLQAIWHVLISETDRLP
jgi:hypothetical protein